MQLNRTHLLGTAAAVISALALTACIPPAPEPTPVPTPSASPVSRPAPVQPAAPVTVALDNWADNLATPGDWTYSSRAGAPMATFGLGRAKPAICHAMQPCRAQYFARKAQQRLGPAHHAHPHRNR